VLMLPTANTNAISNTRHSPARQSRRNIDTARRNEFISE
jgi:hypothetical protein